MADESESSVRRSDRPVRASASGHILVVVPTLGQRESYLSQSLRSIREQNSCIVDLVVVGPPSTDLEEIVARFRGRLISDPGGGLSAAINAGIAAGADPDAFFTWLGDDDLLRPGALASARNLLLRNPDVVMVYGRCDYIDDEGDTFFVSGAGQWAERIMSWGPNLVPQPGGLMRLSAVKDVGGVDEGLKMSMDLDLFLKLRRCGRIVALPQTVAAFRWHDESLTVSQQRASMDEADLVRRRHLRSPLARLTWPAWRWPMRWVLNLAKWNARRRKFRQGSRKATGK